MTNDVLVDATVDRSAARATTVCVVQMTLAPIVVEKAADPLPESEPLTLVDPENVIVAALAIVGMTATAAATTAATRRSFFIVSFHLMVKMQNAGI
jgi:hypothetical protein